MGNAATNTLLWDSYMLIVLSIMISTGLLAGIANFFLSNTEGKAPAHELGKFVVLGIVIALIVPLFLNMTSSNLLEFGRTRPNALFVFAGFCLIFVLLSRRPVENIVNKLKQLGQKRAEGTTLKTPRSPEDFFRAGLSGADLGIMRAISQGGSVYENLSGLGSEIIPSKEFVNDRLVLLRQLGLLELRANEKNILHMCLSAAGSQLLSEVSNGGYV